MFGWFKKSSGTTSPSKTSCQLPLFGKDAMMLAIFAGDKARLENILSSGTSANEVLTRDGDIHSALITAILAPSPALVDIVTVLLAHGADPNFSPKQGRTPLMYACQYDEELVGVLLDAGASPDALDSKNESALIWATSFNKLSSLQCLLERGIDVNLKGEHGRTALHYAAARGNVRYFTELVAANADLNCLTDKGESIESVAVSNKQRVFLEQLIKKKILLLENLSLPAATLLGLNKVVKAKLVNHDRQDLLLCIEQAIFERNLKMFNLILTGVPDLSSSELYKFLDLAISSEAISIVRRLIELGAPINQSGSQGLKPIVGAILLGNANLVRLLIDHGAVTDIVDEKYGKSALDCARESGQSHLYIMLSL